MAYQIEYDIQKMLGSGGHSFVFLGKYGQNTVAVKRVQKVQIPSEGSREEEALKQLNHPNIVKLLHVEDQQHFRYVSPFKV